MVVNVHRSRTAVVVGAGPVGCLTAILLAKSGWTVRVYEARSAVSPPSHRSINLAISARGVTALEVVHPSAAAKLLHNAIPMKGRMIHDMNGNQQSQIYDRLTGQCINSIDRGLLNTTLLEDVLSTPNIRVFFRHKLATADFENRTLLFRHLDTETDVQVAFDFCVGADGSYSNVRRQLMRTVRMDFQQTYIPHEYIELRMKPAKGEDGQPAFPLDPHHLHIWPRSSFMLIALPNKDKSFTCTLFAPTEELARVHDPLSWFRMHFPDALSLIGDKILLEDFKNNPLSSLVAIKAKPYHYKDRVVLLGDAAHSMVPFYGQGLNCGLEDVRVLGILLRDAGVDPTNVSFQTNGQVDSKLESALDAYTLSRHDDLTAISDLAMNNYVEMRHSVATPLYLFLRALDNLFSHLSPQVSPSSFGPLLSRVAFRKSWPGGWIPLYTMVTFRADISYATARRKAEVQARIMTVLACCILGLVLLVMAYLTGRVIRWPVA